MPDLEQSVRINANPARVWELVSDVCRMPEWSPQVTSTRLRSGFDLGLGAEFTNRNREGELEWTTHAEIVRFDAEQELAFKVVENWAVWSFRLQPDGDGTVLTQTRDTPDGISDLSKELTDGFFGGQEPFLETLDAGMRQTLERIKAAAEA
ncbi:MULTISPECIES: SRPBCC family protein [unclassified Nocardioides]|uniref:SRPBCC family protein n=1 Tax=unclassified Nocardioides TaxID=2615069 RepID=UPI0006F6CF13|nr:MULTISPECIES: SRPBCC family protein [unclassified Nocardioides]KRA31378.1 polyketide cyclase [Nocardioides sp. Root614]KRA87998.1 polyketide cyclase [Nocardioides sp. Root682]